MRILVAASLLLATLSSTAFAQEGRPPKAPVVPPPAPTQYTARTQALPSNVELVIPADRKQVDAYADIYAAMMEGIDEDQIFEQTLDSVRQSYASNPGLAYLEARNPGVIDEAIEAMRPSMRSYSDRVRAEYTPKMIDTMRPLFTEEEARIIAAFYRHPVGRKVLSGVSANYTANNAMSSAVNERDVTEEDLRRDSNQTTAKVMKGMTQDDFATLGLLAMKYPVLMRVGELSGAMLPVRMQMENAPLLPSEEKAIQAAIEGVLSKYDN